MKIEALDNIQPILGFDCVKLKHDIQAQIYEDTKDMSRAERNAYRERRVGAFRARMATHKEKNGGLVLREDSPAET